MRTIRIERDAFDVNAEIAALTKDANNVGAVVTFTRPCARRRRSDALTLEHYPGMTEREIARCIDEAEERWPLLGVTIIHRIGKLVPGDRSCWWRRRPRIARLRFPPPIPDGLSEDPCAVLEGRAARRCEDWVEGRASDAERAKRWK